MSLLLPAEEYGAVIKMIDFASLLFVLAVLISAFVGVVRERRQGAQGKNSAENTPKTE